MRTVKQNRTKEQHQQQPDFIMMVFHFSVRRRCWMDHTKQEQEFKPQSPSYRSSVFHKAALMTLLNNTDHYELKCSVQVMGASIHTSSSLHRALKCLSETNRRLYTVKSKRAIPNSQQVTGKHSFEGMERRVYLWVLPETYYSSSYFFQGKVSS